MDESESLEELKQKVSELQEMIIALQKENIALKENKEIGATGELRVSGNTVRKSQVSSTSVGKKKLTMEELTELMKEGVRRKLF